MSGEDYITTHLCPRCAAAQVTTGTGYPTLQCCNCDTEMEVIIAPMEQNDDR